MAETVYLVNYRSWDGAPPVAAFSTRAAALAWMEAHDDDHSLGGISTLVIDEPPMA